MPPLIKHLLRGPWQISCDMLIDGETCAEYGGFIDSAPATYRLYVAEEIHDRQISFSVLIDLPTQQCTAYVIDIWYEGQLMLRDDLKYVGSRTDGNMMSPRRMWKSFRVAPEVWANRQRIPNGDDFENIMCSIRRNGWEYDTTVQPPNHPEMAFQNDSSGDPFYKFIFHRASMRTLKGIGIVLDNDVEKMTLSDLQKEVMRLRAVLLISPPLKDATLDQNERDEKTRIRENVMIKAPRDSCKISL